MIAEQIFKANSEFKSVTHIADSDQWLFTFQDQIYVSALGFWRLLKSNEILFVSSDHGHQFGKPKPLDIVEEVTSELKDKTLKEIIISHNTGDLILSLVDDIKIEIYISSIGYETYEFGIKNVRYIGMGKGELAIIHS